MSISLVFPIVFCKSAHLFLGRPDGPDGVGVLDLLEVDAVDAGQEVAGADAPVLVDRAVGEDLVDHHPALRKLNKKRENNQLCNENKVLGETRGYWNRLDIFSELLIFF